MKQAIINLYSGKQIDLLNPKVEDINIKDIAKGLAYKAHFSGQTPFYFSIAMHSLLVCDLIPREYDNPELLMEALLHDASEAYIGDMVKPLKVHLDSFVEVEGRIQAVVYQAFGLTGKYHSFIKKYDKESQYREIQNFYKREDFSLEEMNSNPESDYHTFMGRYLKYSKLMSNVLETN